MYHTPIKSRRDRRSQRYRLWRNMLVPAINEGLRQNLFALSIEDHPLRREGVAFSKTFRFDHGGIPVIANVFDASYEGYSIKVAFWPTPRGEELIEVINLPPRSMGRAYAHGWLERQAKGAWLETQLEPTVYCAAEAKETVLSLSAAPDGYGDRSPHP